MAMRIKQNPTALTTLRHSNNAMERVKAGVEQLSSGMKINKGADGPASLIASERLRGRIVGLQQAYNNASASVTLMQTAEGALNEVSDYERAVECGTNDFITKPVNKLELITRVRTLLELALVKRGFDT